MTQSLSKIALLTGMVLGTSSITAHSVLAADKQDTKALRQELSQLKKIYQQKIKELEERLDEAEAVQEATQESVEELEVSVSQQGNQKAANTFNPGIGMILNGRYVSSADTFEYELPGFWPAEEIGPGEQGLQIGESELNLSANVDDKFYASATIAFGEGAAEIEEAYIQTLSLGKGLNVKAGQFFSGVGYLAGKHTHADDFADRPLPYQAFFGKNYGDAGVQVSWLAPTDWYWESGFELMRGEGFPAAGAANSGVGATTLFTHVGGDIGENASWQAGLSYINADVDGREADSGEIFSGSNKLTIADFVYKWAPDGNRSVKEFKLQGEWISRDEAGELDDGNGNLNSVDLKQSGWYLQAVYRFAKQWRVGVRTSRLDSDEVPAALTASIFDAGSVAPKQNSLMLDWSNSEFSRIRLQFDQNDLTGDKENVWILQYIAAFGAHGAHSY